MRNVERCVSLLLVCNSNSCVQRDKNITKTKTKTKKITGQMKINSSTLLHVSATDAAYSAAPIASISTNTPFGKVLTATADLAGKGSEKNSA